MYRLFGKRMVGTFLSACGLIILCIPMGLISLIIKITSKGPVIFKQERLGKNQKIFTIYKFRTMVDHAYEIGGIAKSADDSRITKIGTFLRRTSLDELPQMINILKGDMTIIGPRPILPIEFEAYKDNKLYCKRYHVCPGMFCTVDINYRASSDRKLQFEMDADYVEHMSLMEDVRIFFKIIIPVILGKNVYQEESKM